MSPEDTINEIIYNNKSISRFGDGEFTLIFGYGISFQKENINLSNRLYNILKSNEEGLLIGLPNSLNVNYLDNFMIFLKIIGVNGLKTININLCYLTKIKHIILHLLQDFICLIKINQMWINI